MNPDSNTFGSSVVKKTPIIASRCDEVRAEMRMPKASETSTYSRPSAKQQQHAAPHRHGERQTRLDEYESTLPKPTAR
jgi:hypothetical protein